MTYKCSICHSVFEGENCPNCGGVLLVGDKMMTQLFPENAKMSPQCMLFVMEKLLYLPDKAAVPAATWKRALSNAVEQAASRGIPCHERAIPYCDILKTVYPAEDVRIGIFKRKGDRSIRIYRKSTGKYYDICFGKSTDAKAVFELLQKNGCI